MNLKENRNIVIIFMVVMIIISSGIVLGFYYSSLPANNPQKSEQGCESVGGDWSKEQNKCLVSYKKTGEICIDGGQCESGVCFQLPLTEEQKINLINGPLKNVVGICYPDELITGCVEQVFRGTISKESMCLDNQDK